ncbi:MAG: creatininase family protein [Bacteroidetes bacterium]|nr:creatininase family protein [Bacteroidota bacterium]
MPKPWGHLARLRPDALDAIRAETPHVFIPWGAIEWHSVHAPVGLDGMQAEGQCVALAKRLGGVVFPPLYVGADTLHDHYPFPYCVSHAESTVATLATEVLDGLAQQGWTTLVIVTGHAGQGQQDTLHAAVNAFAERHPALRVRMWTSFDLIQDPYPSNHAARGETSHQLAIAPSTVNLAAIPDGPAPTLEGEGVWGEDPRRASAAEGRKMLRLFVERAVLDLGAP